MKYLRNVSLVIMTLATATIANADMVSGYYRSNGTYVMPYYRTPANGIPYDNLSYRGYPSQQPGYVSPRNLGLGSNFKLPSSEFKLPSPSYRLPSPRLSLPSSDFRLPSQSSPFKGLDIGFKTLPKLPSTYKSRTSGF